jgi:hypothetical protein
MDWLIKMEMALANVKRAIAELESVEGLEYIVEELIASKIDLADELAEYKSHSGLDV